MPNPEATLSSEWLQQRDAELFTHLTDWLARLQALLDNAVEDSKARFPKQEKGPAKVTYQLGTSEKYDGKIHEILQDSDEKIFELLEDWLSRFQLFFLDGQQSFGINGHNGELNGDGHDDGESQSTAAKTKKDDYHSERSRNVHSYHGVRHLHQSATGSSMNLTQMYSLEEEEKDERFKCREYCMQMEWSRGTPVPPSLPFAWQRFLYPYVFSWVFEAFFAVVIMSNSLFLGIQVEIAAKNIGQEPGDAIFFVASIYTCLFTIELLLRLLVGWHTVVKSDFAWLMLDVLVVVSSLMEFVLEIILRSDQSATQNVSTSMRMVRILRVAKITRAIRVVRLVKFIRSLKTLLYCIGRTLRAMAWSGVLLIMIIFLFSLIFTDICTDFRAERPVGDPTGDLLAKRFGSLELSMHTLFAAVTGGLTWVEVSDALAEVNFVWQLLFEVYIAFSLFAVLNVMTGVFCQSAIESAERDHELILQNVAHEKAKYFRAVRRLFNQLDRNGDGGVSIREFKDAMKDPQLHAVFDALEITPGDAWALFTQLDRDGDSEVNVDEFLEGCMLLKGPARSIDVIGIKRDLLRLQERMDTYMTDVGEVKRIVSRPLRISR